MGVNFEPDSVLGSAMGRNRIELDQKFTDLINSISVFRKDLTKVASVAQTDLHMKFGFKSPSVATAGGGANERRPHAATATPAIIPVASPYITSDNKQLINPPVLSKVSYAEKDRQSEDRPCVSNRELPCCRYIDSNFPSESDTGNEMGNKISPIKSEKVNILTSLIFEHPPFCPKVINGNTVPPAVVKPSQLHELISSCVSYREVIPPHVRLNHLSPHDALKHRFTSLKTDLIFLQLRVSKGIFS